MKQNFPKFLVVGLVIVILVNILIFGWLLADVFSGPNEPKEPTTEEPTTEEMPTREPTPYDEVLEEYFTQWAKLYMDEEDTGFDTKRWEFIQKWKASLGGIIFQNVQAISTSVEVLNETEDEVRLWVGVYEIRPYVFTSGKVKTMKGSADFILRLAKQDGGYRISSVSYCDRMLGFEMGLEEDLKLLRRPTD